MNEYSEKRLYISQMIAGYTSGKSVCDALKECSFILPEDGDMYGRVTTCITMLMTGEGLPEDSPLKSTLSQIDQGEPSLVILHDMIVHAEITGCIDSDMFRTYEEMISFIDDKKEHRDRRVFKNEKKYIALYERLKKCRRKNASKRLRKELIEGLKNELILCMTSMVIYTRMTEVHTALKRTYALTHGPVKSQVKNMRKRYEAGEDTATVCSGFLYELDLPELTQCITCCFMGEADRYVIPVGELFGAQRTRSKMRIPGKEICAVIVAVCLGTVGIMGILTKENKKEGRLRNALSQALNVAVGEMKEEKGTNQIMAGFMQQMLKQVDDDIDLTVRICDLDEIDQTMEVEAIGEYDSFLGDRRRISVRRRLSF